MEGAGFFGATLDATEKTVIIYLLLDGRVAQLGERFLDAEEVVGSSPAAPTTKAPDRGLFIFYLSSFLDPDL